MFRAALGVLYHFGCKLEVSQTILYTTSMTEALSSGIQEWDANPEVLAELSRTGSVFLMESAQSSSEIARGLVHRLPTVDGKPYNAVLLEPGNFLALEKHLVAHIGTHPEQGAGLVVRDLEKNQVEEVALIMKSLGLGDKLVVLESDLEKRQQLAGSENIVLSGATVLASPDTSSEAASDLSWLTLAESVRNLIRPGFQRIVHEEQIVGLVSYAASLPDGMGMLGVVQTTDMDGSKAQVVVDCLQDGKTFVPVWHAHDERMVNMTMEALRAAGRETKVLSFDPPETIVGDAIFQAKSSNFNLETDLIGVAESLGAHKLS